MTNFFTEDPPPAPSNRAGIGLAILIVAFGVVYFLLCWMRFQEFYGTNWDLGIGMQGLWTTTHGRVLWEAADYETIGAGSMLSIHSTYIGIPVAYLYALAPGPAMLLAIQSAVVVSSAIPLYLVARKAGLPEWWTLLALAAYLLTFTISSSILYDFHWEAFLPAEFVWTYYLWSQRRYVLAFIPAIVGVLTLEVFPFLLVGLFLYSAYPSLEKFLRRPVQSVRAVVGDFRTYLIRAWPLAVLLAFSLLSYIMLRYLQHDVLPHLVGSPIATINAQVAQGYQQLFGVTALTDTIPPSFVYWLLIFAAFGFIPLLTRQSLLLLSLPWFWASVFVQPHYSLAFGTQYAFIAVATVSIAFIEGLASIYKSSVSADHKALLPLEWMLVVVPFFLVTLFYPTDLLRSTLRGEMLLLLLAVGILLVLGLVIITRIPAKGTKRTLWKTTSTIRDQDGIVSRRTSRIVTRKTPSRGTPIVWGLRKYRPRTGPLLVSLLVIVVAANFALSPLNPVNFGASIFPGYRFSWSTNPAYADMSIALENLPKNAVILASSNMFPFVADDDHAYSLLFASPTGIPYLPFNATKLPPYVLLSTSEWSAVPTFLRAVLFNPSVYGIVSMVYSTVYPGAIYLLETGYKGPADLLQAEPFTTPILLCPSQFTIGPSGRVIPQTGTVCGQEIESAAAANLSGNGHTVWFGPYLTLLPGEYNVTMSLRGGDHSGHNASAQIVFLNGGGYGSTSYAFNLNGGSLKPVAWTNFTIHLDLTAPVSGFEFRGYLDYNGGTAPANAVGYVDLNFIQVVRVA